MDKRHPQSFQQLEKLGEGTYATVSISPTCVEAMSITDHGCNRSSRDETDIPANLSLSKKSISTRKKAHHPQPSVKSRS